MTGDPRKPDERPVRGYRFPHHLRLRNRSEFEAVYESGRRRFAGPLVVHALPNGLDHLRLGLSVPRRVGNAVRRNRIKRRLRESFRLMQHDLPGGYDLVINVRPHEPLPLAEYQRVLVKAARQLHRAWSDDPAIPTASPPNPKADPPRG